MLKPTTFCAGSQKIKTTKVIIGDLISPFHPSHYSLLCLEILQAVTFALFR